MLEIGNNWTLRPVSHIKCGMNVFDKKVLNAGKCQLYSCYRSWVIKGKPTTNKGGKNTPLTPIRDVFAKWNRSAGLD